MYLDFVSNMPNRLKSKIRLAIKSCSLNISTLNPRGVILLSQSHFSLSHDSETTFCIAKAGKHKTSKPH